MAASCQTLVLTLLRRKCCILNAVRNYSIRPPPTYGLQTRIDELKRDHQKTKLPTLKERLKELNPEDPEVTETIDIGVEYKPSPELKKQSLRLWRNRKHNSELEQAARLQQLQVPLDEVKDIWQVEMGPYQVKAVAEHYGIYEDLFPGAYFLPVVPLHVSYDYDEESVTPVYRGNRISPTEASKAPNVDFEAEEGCLYTLLMTNPDGHLTDNESEYLHWFVGNIPAGDVSQGQTVCDYMQPFPPRGTGFHRHILVLLKQNAHIDYTALQRPPNCTSLSQRTFSTPDFMRSHHQVLTPVGLCFFQSEHDDSVRDFYHNVLDMRAPSFEYAHPPFYHPPPVAYPTKQPFDKYFDRYRDKKDLAEEVLKEKLSMISPFKQYKRPEYPLIHQARRWEKPSWLIRRENKMALRQEQFKDLP